MMSLSPEQYASAVEDMTSHIRHKQSQIDQERAAIKALREKIDIHLKAIEDHYRDIGRCERTVEILSATAATRRRIEERYSEVIIEQSHVLPC